MKIKFYHLKKDGVIAKTPNYTESLTKNFCCFNLLNVDDDTYYCDIKSLFEIYLEVINTNLGLTDQMFIGNTPVSFEKLKDVLKTKTNVFLNQYIFPKVISFEKRMYELSEFHKSNINNIHYCAFEMEKYVDEYVGIYTKCQQLKTGSLIYKEQETDEDDDGWQTYKEIIPDITPVTAEELI